MRSVLPWLAVSAGALGLIASFVRLGDGPLYLVFPIIALAAAVFAFMERGYWVGGLLVVVSTVGFLSLGEVSVNLNEAETSNTVLPGLEDMLGIPFQVASSALVSAGVLALRWGAMDPPGLRAGAAVALGVAFIGFMMTASNDYGEVGSAMVVPLLAGILGLAAALVIKLRAPAF